MYRIWGKMKGESKSTRFLVSISALAFVLIFHSTDCDQIESTSTTTSSPTNKSVTHNIARTVRERETLLKTPHDHSEDGKINIMGKAAGLTSSVNNNTAKFCNSTKENDCWSKLPQLPKVGIPATKEELDVACRAFDLGMECFEEEIKCLNKANRAKARESVLGADETFTFLCRDAKFRNEFLGHEGCFKKISPHYDECSKRLISDIKRTMAKHNDNSLNFCCIRLRFLQCVQEVSNLYCNEKASTFIQTMAKTLVRSEMKHPVPPECISVTPLNCTASSGTYPLHSNRPSTIISVMFSIISLILSFHP